MGVFFYNNFFHESIVVLLIIVTILSAYIALANPPEDEPASYQLFLVIVTLNYWLYMFYRKK